MANFIQDIGKILNQGVYKVHFIYKDENELDKPLKRTHVVFDDDNLSAISINENF